MKLAQRLAAGPTRAVVATSALLEESEHSSYGAQFRREIEVQAEIRRSEDASAAAFGSVQRVKPPPSDRRLRQMFLFCSITVTPQG
jgi:2-(1,2-epoxy-1,2-dihydrophenyl)acetyl-CoA isomerase